MRKLYAMWMLVCFSVAQLNAQESNKGQLTGSLESNSIYYVEDTGLDAGSSVNPDDHFGSNNYLKLDYSYGKFSAGIQLEGFLPALQGYDYAVYGNGKRTLLGAKYVSWQDENFGFRAGDIYDQYGSGLVFRSYEDRALGFNNSIEGVQGRYEYKEYVRLSGLYGRPRLYLDYADSYVRGFDASVSLSSLLGLQNMNLNVEGSYVNRYEDLKENADLIDILTTSNLDMFSGRINWDWNDWTIRAEYVSKGKDLPTSVSANMVDGNAILVELGYSHNRFSVLGTFRRLEHMNTMLTLIGEGAGNVLNYLPALTRQYTYMLANLNPYQVNADGDAGGQIDAYYSIRGDKQRNDYWNFHANFSTFYSDKDLTGESRLLWRDINADVEHQWNKRWKTAFLVSVQEWSPSHGMQDVTYASNIFVLDNTYKFNKKTALRAEVQYLYSTDYEKDWVAALVELSLAPRWSFAVSDMWNHGTTDKHYYNASVSYTQHRTRLQLSYGRNRAGFVCSGGVCRYQPAYTGANLTLTTSF